MPYHGVCDVRPSVPRGYEGYYCGGLTAAHRLHRGPRDFERLCETEDPDLARNATLWALRPDHAGCDKNGSTMATEVPGTMTVEDC